MLLNSAEISLNSCVHRSLIDQILNDDTHTDNAKLHQQVIIIRRSIKGCNYSPTGNKYTTKSIVT